MAKETSIERAKCHATPVLSRALEANNRIQGLSALSVSSITQLRVSSTISTIIGEISE